VNRRFLESRQGATVESDGVHFGLYSESATHVWVCLFDERGHETRVPLTERSGFVWHGKVRGIGAGQRYGFRVDGPWDLARGQRHNPQKLLVDPYARLIEGKVSYRGGAVFGHAADGTRDPVDSAPFAPKSVVIDDAFDWEGDAPPEVAWKDTVLYEAHVKGLTKLHPDVPSELRGTYGGLASEAAIGHLRALGVTAVELLPIHEVADEPFIVKRGQVNYWGYSTLGYFTPDQRLASRPGEQVREFKAMVKALHRAGIEVILDVVYNHSCEGDERGPTLFLRGIDNRVYYKLGDGGARYENYTGCGNSLNVQHPQVLKLITDSLRYWVTEMHVDGFRFDLTTTLGREAVDFSPRAAFFQAISQDPILSTVKLIAEPWDCASMQLGGYPVGWREWNAHFRDGMRRFWNGHQRSLGEIGYRLSGSSDLFQRPGKTPTASINFITAHDGFTLRDLVSYERKHNLANGEDNRDGTSDNASINFGVEGESEDPYVKRARARQVRNLFAMLLLAPGVPMIVAGDEIGRTQKGNNNPYAIDDETAWVSWDLSPEQKTLRDFCARLIRLRGELPALSRETFFSTDEMAWLRPDGKPMRGEDWSHPTRLALMAYLRGELLLLINGEGDDMSFRLPQVADGFRVLVDTRDPDGGPETAKLLPGSTYSMPGRCFALLAAENVG
jgi:isoamylase